MLGTPHPTKPSYSFERNIKFSPKSDPDIPKNWIVGPPLADQRHAWELECDGYIGLYSPTEAENV